ncbi:hypothetical protein JDV09_25950 [Mycobacterium sp. Y57]|uniref:lipopolysaccharide biosynthesis protein n=1 Tax=Mycolicibacterium xanthum TaxID=2796469 RepID=UPI001C85EFCC|nr:hypothetical protein [Mycolicibacterium xanthum]MBX7435508.1 hypothetical protein [Mycolicibacterium xanthum]
MDLGANAYWIREIASRRITQHELNVKITTRIIVALAIATVVIVTAILTAPVFVATGVLLITTSTVQTLLVPLSAARRAETVGWLFLFGRVVAIALFVGQTAIAVRPGLALWTSLAVGDVALAVCALTVTPAPSRLRIGVRTLSNPWAGARWYSLSTLSTSAQQLDLPIVGFCAGPTAAGIYGGVNRWTQPMMLIIGAFASAAAPFLAAESHLRDLRWQILRASWILAAAVALAIGVIFTAPWLVPFLLGDAFASSAAVLQWLAGGMILNAIAQPLIVALQSRRFDHVTAIILLVSVLVQLVVVAVLAPALGALSAGIGFFTSQVLQTTSCIAAIVWWRRNRLRE